MNASIQESKGGANDKNRRSHNKVNKTEKRGKYSPDEEDDLEGVGVRLGS